MKYLKKLRLVNVGPIEDLSIDTEFNDLNQPKPIVLVGSNGAGKSIVLSTIVDALTEFAVAAGYGDITEPYMGGGHHFFRISGGMLTRSGASKHVSSVAMGTQQPAEGDATWRYTDKTGSFTPEEWKDIVGTEIKYPDDSSGNNKQVDIALNPSRKAQDTEAAKVDFKKSVYCFFPGNRSEKPFWANTMTDKESVRDGAGRFSNELGKPLSCTESAPQNATWLMDVILDDLATKHSQNIEFVRVLKQRNPSDQRVDLNEVDQAVQPAVLSAFANANSLLTVLLGYPARFGVLSRQNNKRLHFLRTDRPEAGSLHISHLSHGQSSLLGIFCTIMRYADHMQSISLSDIEGLVLIDEADAGLHIEYQRGVLPKLMRLMPKVQFVITTHSPLLLLGLEKEYGENGVQIIEIPTGRRISGEEFSEFDDAFAAIESTKKFKTSFDELIRQESNKPILLVEGQSDEILIRAAWQKLRGSADFPFVFSGKLDRTHLRMVLSDIGKTGVNTSLPILALWDFDDAYSDWETLIKKKKGEAQYAEIDNRTEDLGLICKASNGAQIFGALLPVPQFRAEQASRSFGKSSVLCTELLFADSVLDTLGVVEKSSAVGGGKIAKLKSNDKVVLASSLALLNADAFQNFEPLLKLIEEFLLPKPTTETAT
jgi:AAA domain, putative AbiEii toxin, Type IV TA system